MSKFMSAFHRHGFDPDQARRRIEAILREIAPTPSPEPRTAVHHAGRHVQGTLNLSDHLPLLFTLDV